jgi:DNA-binding response OmpR family regulator
MKRILIIEDDLDIASLQRDYIEANNMSAVIALDGSQGEKLAREEHFDLILLDVMLPKKDGFEICTSIREHSNIPILFVSAKMNEIDKIKGLGCGANDYIVKPFQPHELIARIKAQIANYERLTKPKDDQMLAFPNLRIDLKAHEVFIKDEPVFFPNKEYELLVFFATHPNIVFSKQELFERIWDQNAFGDINTVTVHINRIRDKLTIDESMPKYIETVWARGYRFRKY